MCCCDPEGLAKQLIAEHTMYKKIHILIRRCQQIRSSHFFSSFLLLMYRPSPARLDLNSKDFLNIHCGLGLSRKSVIADFIRNRYAADRLRPSRR